jgi:ATP-dependent RNA helicase DHX8/PRP22
MLQAENIFYRPKQEQATADLKRSRFNRYEGDQLTYLQVYKQWVKNNYSNSWCSRNFVNTKAMRKAQDIRKQLVTIMERYNLPIKSCKKDTIKVQQAITSGFFQNTAKKDLKDGYRTLVENQPCYIHPSSSLFHHQPKWVVFFKILFTSREYMRDIISIEPQWLIELAPNIFKKTDVMTISKRKRNEKIEPLFKHGEQDGSWRISRVVYQDK